MLSSSSSRIRSPSSARSPRRFLQDITADSNGPATVTARAWTRGTGNGEMEDEEGISPYLSDADVYLYTHNSRSFVP